jgi:hypothetical protein
MNGERQPTICCPRSHSGALLFPSALPWLVLAHTHLLSTRLLGSRTPTSRTATALLLCRDWQRPLIGCRPRVGLAPRPRSSSVPVYIPSSARCYLSAPPRLAPGDVCDQRQPGSLPVPGHTPRASLIPLRSRSTTKKHRGSSLVPRAILSSRSVTLSSPRLPSRIPGSTPSASYPTSLVSTPRLIACRTVLVRRHDPIRRLCPPLSPAAVLSVVQSLLPAAGTQGPQCPRRSVAPTVASIWRGRLRPQCTCRCWLPPAM